MTEPSRLIDCSPRLHPGIGVWPGDTPLTREVLAEVADGSSVTLSTLHATVHLGTHTDAWSHIVDGAPDIASMPLDAYVGPCHVVTVEPGGRSADGTPIVVPADLPATTTEALVAGDLERILFATGTFVDPDDFTTDFAALSAELVEHLADHGVRLIGIDTPSVDPFASKDLPAHHAFVERRVAILEGLVLTDVADGAYDLIAPPLPLEGFDASPVRVLLRTTP